VTSRRLFEALIAALVITAGGRAGASEVAVFLVSTDDLEAAREAGAAIGLAKPIAGGEVHFYRPGDLVPRFSVAAGEAIDLPRGEWIWTGEAPGWVVVEPGRMHLGDESSSGAAHEVFWPAVPACDVRLDEPSGWRGVQRADFVSLAHGSVHPLVPGAGARLNVPAGPFLHYTVGSRGLVAVSRIRHCSSGDRVEVAAPDPPARGTQTLLVHARLPPVEGAPLSATELESELSIGDATVRATAVVAAAGRWSVFFLDVPATAPGEIALTHPRLRAQMIRVDPVSGSARELPEVALSRRHEIEVTVDYQPIGQHRVERLELRRCPGGPPRLDRRECPDVITDVTLRRGVETYRFEDLDDGKYTLDADIDGEVVRGIGAGVRPRLEGNRPPPTYPIVPLREYELFGHLVVEGEPVPGEVRLQPVAGGDLAVRRFRTGEDLFYRLTYFGRAIVARDPVKRLAGDSARPLDQQLGMDREYALVACSDESVCRTLAPAIIRGGGRLDIPIPSDRYLVVEVVDSATGAPIPDADVAVAGTSPKRLVFLDGQVDWEARDPTGELSIQRFRSGSEGKVTVVSPPDELGLITARRAGYREESHVPPTAVPGEGLRVRLALAREEARGAPVRLRTRGGSALAGALVVPIAARGGLDRTCATNADAAGVVRLEDRCLVGRKLVLFHPVARLEVIPGERFWAGEIEAEAAPVPAIRLRLLDDGGEPAANRPLALRVGDVVLSPDALLFATTRTGAPWPFHTDARGEALMVGVDPMAPDVPEILLTIDGDEVAARPAGVGPGEVWVVAPP